MGYMELQLIKINLYSNYHSFGSCFLHDFLKKSTQLIGEFFFSLIQAMHSQNLNKQTFWNGFFPKHSRVFDWNWTIKHSKIWKILLFSSKISAFYCVCTFVLPFLVHLVVINIYTYSIIGCDTWSSCKFEITFYNLRHLIGMTPIIALQFWNKRTRTIIFASDHFNCVDIFQVKNVRFVRMSWLLHYLHSFASLISNICKTRIILQMHTNDAFLNVIYITRMSMAFFLHWKYYSNNMCMACTDTNSLSETSVIWVKYMFDWSYWQTKCWKSVDFIIWKYKKMLTHVT